MHCPSLDSVGVYIFTALYAAAFSVNLSVQSGNPLIKSDEGVLRSAINICQGGPCLKPRKSADIPVRAHHLPPILPKARREVKAMQIFPSIPHELRWSCMHLSVYPLLKLFSGSKVILILAS